MDERLAGKLRILADAAKYDASCASSGAPKRSGGRTGLGSTSNGICHAYTPDGRCISLLKILLTNYCQFDCHYCVNRVSSNVKRARFSVEEVVDLTLGFYKRNYIEGLFLSSGIIQSPDYTMEQVLQVAKTLRTVHHFGGYIHLKAIPGSSERLLHEAGSWADRLSANVELPTQDDLTKLAPEKQLVTIRQTMSGITSDVERSKEELRGTEKIVSAAGAAPKRISTRRSKFAPAGQSTQMVVGATETNDA